ncbi:MAG: hypothetical protein Q8S73_10110 [Deltaproteobacteria bacterium]|nr:hypothetical protein [Myxococcales bacterium]MDP3214447.1 hypothetical protein [Deltaproteobacteria bacterium]
MDRNEPKPASDPALHGLVESKLVKVFGVERGMVLLDGLLSQLGLAAVDTTADLARLADLLEKQPGFEGTVGAVLSVMAAMRRSQGR